MKSTTGSKLREQSYQDYIKESVPTDGKLNVSFQFNEYAHHYGIPVKLAQNSPQGIAKIARNVIAIYSRWMSNEINREWELGTW